jgi:hypothetical protein
MKTVEYIDKELPVNMLIEYIKKYSISTPHSQGFTESIEAFFKIEFQKNITARDINAVHDENNNNIPLIAKPPLGIMPRYLHDESRMIEIYSAVSRYYHAGKAIPVEWIEEYNELTKSIRNEKSKA